MTWEQVKTFGLIMFLGWVLHVTISTALKLMG